MIKEIISDYENGIDIPCLAERYNMTCAEIEAIVESNEND
jgi:Mor family transcriptional regulator